MSACGSAGNDALFSSTGAPVGSAGTAQAAGGASAGTGDVAAGGNSTISAGGTLPFNAAGASSGGSPTGGTGSGYVGGATGSGGTSGAHGGAAPVDNGGAAGKAGSAGSGGAGPVAGAGGSAPVLNFDLIDDLEDGDINILNLNGRSGSWYTFNDKSGGTQSAAVALLNPKRGASTRAMETTGQNFTTWGAGLGFNLNQNGATISAYDASAFQGIRFFARSTKPSTLITIQIPTNQTDPRGGLCGNDCYHNFAVQRMFTTEWSDFVIYFSEFEQDLKITTTTINRAQLYAVEYLTQPNAPFDVFIDDVAFIEKN